MALTSTPHSTEKRWLRTGLGYALSYACIIALVLFMMARYGWNAYFGGVKPFILILPVYFWAVYRPSFFPPWAIVTLSLIMDLFLGAPLGLSALIALIAQFTVIKLSRTLREFPAPMIAVLAIIPIALAEILRWLGISILSSEFQPLLPAALAAVQGFVIYIPLSFIFHQSLKMATPS